jgi:hypothetical protein
VSKLTPMTWYVKVKRLQNQIFVLIWEVSWFDILDLFLSKFTLLGPKIMFKSSFEFEIIAKPENLGIDELLTFQIQIHYFTFLKYWPIKINK